MNKKLTVTLEVLQNVEKRFSETKEFIKQNMQEVCEREHITVTEVIYFAFLFVVCMSVPDFCLFLRF